MEILKAVLTWIDIIIMVLFIGLVAIQTSRSEGIFSPGAADSMFGKAKPGFDDNLSRLDPDSGSVDVRADRGRDLHALMVHIEKLTLGVLQANCYLVQCLHNAPDRLSSTPDWSQSACLARLHALGDPPVAAISGNARAL
jgi:hypothetical protein